MVHYGNVHNMFELQERIASMDGMGGGGGVMRICNTDRLYDFGQPQFINPFGTSPGYTWAGVYGKHAL